MSRNARLQLLIFALVGRLFCAGAQEAMPMQPTNGAVRIVVVQGDHLLDAFLPVESRVQQAFDRGLRYLTHQPTVQNAWLSLVKTNDVVGIKVFSTPGPVSGTRPAVVEAIARGLIAAGLPATNIIIWDRHAIDLRIAGFFDLGRKLGVRVAGAEDTGYDPDTFYLPDFPVLGQLVWGDLEFGKTNLDNIIGKRSFVSKLVSQQMTKIISVAPLMNETSAGVCGHLFSLGLGSVDNTRRFDGMPDRLAVALPEINALPIIGDRVVLYVTDALLLQYEGGPSGYLQFSSVKNQIWLSHDPVALDTMALRELALQRKLLETTKMPSNLMIYTNAALLQLGVDDPARVRVEKAP